MRFFHKEIEAYLVAEGLFDDQVTEDGKFSKLLNSFSIQSIHQQGKYSPD